MGITLENNNRTVSYPLAKPLNWYHGHVVKTFETLPKNGVLIELIKRIIVIALIPIAYPILGALALIRKILPIHGQSGERNHTNQLTRNPCPEFNLLRNTLSSSKKIKAFLNITKIRSDFNEVEMWTYKANSTNESGNLINAIQRDLTTKLPNEFGEQIKYKYAILHQDESDTWHLITRSKDHTGDEVVGGDTDLVSDYLNIVLTGMDYNERPNITLDEFMNLQSNWD